MASIPIKMLICLENFSTLIVNGDFSSSVLFKVSAICPISVFKPVPITIASALPVMTLVPANNMFILDDIPKFLFGSFLEFFSIATLSPVRIDSSTVKL